MMNRLILKYLLLMMGLFLGSNSYGQIGGRNVFKFVNLSSSARITGLGGYAISILDDDLTLAMTNPASLNKKMDKSISFQQNSLFADTKSGVFAYSQHYKPWDISFMGAIQYINYGNFDLTNVFGDNEGSFDASEFAAVIGAGKSLNENYHIGVNLKYVGSNLESYQSSGLLANAAIMYVDQSKDIVGSLIFQNIGGQFSGYTNNREPINFEILAGFSKRLEHLPFKYSIIYHNLNRWNILYDDPNTEESSFFIEESKDRSAFSIFGDNLLRHFVVNGEFLLGKTDNFNLRIGYNHFRRKELKLENTFSLAGFSFGFGFKIYHFKLDYGYAIYHKGANVHHIGISTHINEFKRKENKVINTGGGIGDILPE